MLVSEFAQSLLRIRVNWEFHFLWFSLSAIQLGFWARHIVPSFFLDLPVGPFSISIGPCQPNPQLGRATSVIATIRQLFALPAAGTVLLFFI